MISKTIKYTDFNGKEVTEVFYFHLTKVDMIELSADGSFEDTVKNAAARKDKLAIFHAFKRIIAMSVGTRTEDGANFVRTEAYRDKFLSSPAFEELVMELFTSDDKGAEFVKGLIPAGMIEQVEKQLDSKNTNAPDPFAEEPAWIREQRVPSPQEFAAATDEQKKLAFSRQLGAK